VWQAGPSGITRATSASPSQSSLSSATRMVLPSSALDELLLHEGAEIVTGLTNPFTEVKRSHTRQEAESTDLPGPAGDDESADE
jgi:hypothetical protein